MAEATDPKGISCERVIEYLCEHFGEEEDSERCRTVKAHVEKCPSCTAYCTSLDAMIALYRAASPSFPEDARKQLFEILGIT
ncbi:MAG: hypothetical protein QHI48_10840 [Bacteroidota bacterium]|nr:hypothetical protein [Bacteroidota bacterium]